MDYLCLLFHPEWRGTLGKSTEVKKSLGLNKRGQILLKEACQVADSVLSCSRPRGHDCPQYIGLYPFLIADHLLKFIKFYTHLIKTKRIFSSELSRSEKNSLILEYFGFHL